MTRTKSLIAAIALIALTLSGQTFAQGSPQTLSLMKVDPLSLATGYRASKVVGSSVFNESGEDIGTIDDLIITPSDTVPFVILSVGGFLGMGTRYVAISSSVLDVHEKRMLLRGATKDTLKTLPEFKYSVN